MSVLKTKSVFIRNFHMPLWILCLVFSWSVLAQELTTYVSTLQNQGDFILSESGKSAPLIISPNDYKGVIRALKDLQSDINKVTNNESELIYSDKPEAKQIVIAGTLGKSTFIDNLVSEGKLDVQDISGKWEHYKIQVINAPIEGVDKALVIAGSDKRGTIYGIYDISEKIGVSPWYWWADTPVVHKPSLYVKSSVNHTQGPKVKYRGIFLNDEWPALSNWAHEKFGGFNSKFYQKVFELLLRLKANYLWPAMWPPRAFWNEDDKNADLANEMGIVMGTSHHEPLTRAHAEWKKKKFGAWNYATNPKRLEDFWEAGVQRSLNHETLYTIGMRGDGDEAMSEDTAIELLERVVKKQREIITNVTGKPAKKTPQLWALYKEVQEYYDQGMTVPDDVTLLLCDDNWGNIRKLPELDAKPRSGGYGIYYHFDYVGGPRSYRWINTNQIERTWEQMYLAYQHHVNNIWIVNVGDLKPMELPISFFLNLAWNPEQWYADNLQTFYTQWTKQQFGEHHTNEIADMLRMYTKYNNSIKHELLDENTYSLTHFNEWQRVAAEYAALARKSEAVKKALPEIYQDTYYQLVHFPIIASDNLVQMYYHDALNTRAAKQQRSTVNFHADKVKELFVKDSLLAVEHHTINSGKWNHMMSQTHIGYSSWNHPRTNIIPKTTRLDIPNEAKPALAVEGSDTIATQGETLTLPVFYSFNPKSHTIELFNQGQLPYDYKVVKCLKWIDKIQKKGKVKDSETLSISVKWDKLKPGITTDVIKIKTGDIMQSVAITAHKMDTSKSKGFIEQDGYIAIEADHFSSQVAPQPFQWKVVENLGKTGSSVISLPVEKGRVPLSKDSPKLSYNVHFVNKGKVKVHAYFSPTINYSTRGGMYYGLSFDDEKPLQINYDNEPTIFNYNGRVPKNWHRHVSNSIKIITTEFDIIEPGNHVLNFFRVDEGLVLQKIVIETDTLPKSYLGPLESAAN